MSTQPQPLEQRFWSKVDRRGDDECWPWTGAKTHNGYGRLSFGPKSGHRLVRATHIAWQIANGKPFPHGLLACHSCDNPSCVNPGHIWPGTPAENMADKVRKGRASAPRPRIRSHCQRGHPLSGANYVLHGPDRRICRECRNARQRKSYLKCKLRDAAQA